MVSCNLLYIIAFISILLYDDFMAKESFIAYFFSFFLKRGSVIYRVFNQFTMFPLIILFTMFPEITFWNNMFTITC